MALFRSKAFKVSFDPAFDDLDLAEARDEFAQGRWEPARDLLEDTGTGWDKRAHRVRVLAETPSAGAWIERWQSLDPHNPDAAVLRAQVEVLRILHARGRPRDAGSPTSPRQAEQQCRRAAEMNPKDPVPWITLLTLARIQGLNRDKFWSRWQELQDRDPWNRDGNHQALIYLFATWQGSHAEMYDFAAWLAEQAPAGSPLVAMPLVAHAEAYRAHAADPRPRQRAGLDYHWTGEQVGAVLDDTLTFWFKRDHFSHAQAKADLNYLAHALIYADRLDDAREVLAAIGPHVTTIPWAYTGEPETVFAHWRHRLLDE